MEEFIVSPLLSCLLPTTVTLLQAFLTRKELLARGDFVDYERLECTPKVSKRV